MEKYIEAVRAALKTLPEREERVIVMRYGLDGHAGMTRKAIGKEFGVSGERIRQIEAKAMRRLRHPSRSRALRVFIREDK